MDQDTHDTVLDRRRQALLIATLQTYIPAVATMDSEQLSDKIDDYIRAHDNYRHDNYEYLTQFNSYIEQTTYEQQDDEDQSE